MNETGETKKKSKKTKIIIIVILVSLMLCAIIGSLSSNEKDNEEEQVGINYTSVVETIVAEYTQTAAANVTSTPIPTNTDVPTPTSTTDPQTATAMAYQATQDYIAMFSEIDYRELATYSNNHVGEMVIARGRIFNVIDDQDFQMYFTNTYDSLYVMTLEKFTGLYEDDNVIVYGFVYGEYCGTNAFGAEVCSPALVGSFFVKE